MSPDEAEAALRIRIPDRVRSLYAGADGRFDEGGQWWVVWPLDRLVSDNARAWRDGTLPTSLLAFGDDGTGNPFCVSLTDSRDEVLRWSWIEGEVERSEGPVSTFTREWLGEG